MNKIKMVFLGLWASVVAGCAQYQMIPTYHPIVGKQGQFCAAECGKLAQSCHEICKVEYKQCYTLAKERAEQKYPIALKEYEAELTEFKLDMHMHFLLSSHGRHGAYVGLGGRQCDKYGNCFFGGVNMPPYWHDYYEENKPERPTLESLTTREARVCTTDCGCDKSHDRCYIACGGQVTYRKECSAFCSGESS